MIDVYLTLASHTFAYNFESSDLLPYKMCCVPRVGERIAIDDRVAQFIKGRKHLNEYALGEKNFVINVIYFNDKIIVNLGLNPSLFPATVWYNNTWEDIYLRAMPKIGDKIRSQKFKDLYVSEIIHKSNGDIQIMVSPNKPVEGTNIADNKTFRVQVVNDMINVNIENTPDVNISGQDAPLEVQGRFFK